MAGAILALAVGLSRLGRSGAHAVGRLAEEAPRCGGRGERLITTYASWQWMFAINVPLGIVAFGFAWRLITESATGTPPPLDRLGVVLTCGALGGVTYAGQVVSDGTPRWTLAIALAVASASLFAVGTWHLLPGRAAPQARVDDSAARAGARTVRDSCRKPTPIPVSS
jgi:hypothetical protein